VKTWETRKTVGAVAVAAAIAAFGGNAIAAAADGGFHGFHATSGGFHGARPSGPPPSAHRDDDEAESLHGERVVAADDHGGFETLVSQTGRVTAISPTSVTARSADGFSQTYVIREATPAAPPPFHVDDEVTINARREGKAVVVTTIRPPIAIGH
jgi:hypothetical protein